MAYYEINPNLRFNLLYLDSKIDLGLALFFSCGLIQGREVLLMISSPGAEVIPYLCGGPAGHTGPRPAGHQPVNHPEKAGFRPQHR